MEYSMKLRTWPELVIVVGVLLVGIAIAFPEYLKSRRTSNERKLEGRMREIGRAQADFRSNDSDGNGKNDFWTADIAGLCIIRPLRPDGSLGDRGIALIDPALAAADGAASIGLAEYSTGLVGPDRPFARYQPLDGYLYRAAGSDGISTPPLREDTDPSPHYRRCHNLERFAVACYPTSRRWSGALACIYNQDGSIRHLTLSPRYRCEYEGGPSGSSTRIQESGESNMDAGDYPLNPNAVGYSMHGC